MTVPYRQNFLKSLWIWKGSMWSAVWKDLLIFMIIYYTINIPLRFATSMEQQDHFRVVKQEINKRLSNYNLIFILGFFLSHIVARWWHQFELVSGNPFNFATCITSHVRMGKYMDEELAQNRRFSMIRWVMLMTILGWSRHAIRIKKRFPTIDHLVAAHLATKEEGEMLKETVKNAPYGSWWQPSIWIYNLIYEMMREGSIDSIIAVSLENQLGEYRGKLGKLMNYHWVPIPLPYTQLVTSATYAYFLTDIILHQMIQSDEVDIIIPIFFIIKFVLVMGTLRTSEQIIDPFGLDADDFEINWLLDWSINTCQLQIGKLHGQLPKIIDNQITKEKVVRLNHTIGSSKIDSNPYISRVNKWKKIKPADMNIAPDDHQCHAMVLSGGLTTANCSDFYPVEDSVQTLFITKNGHAVKESDSTAKSIERNNVSIIKLE